ncbi:MAG: hypothetical protein COS99_03370 [Candidatus Omnitrophica bacterium CG07_land_8_20_14_0_80_42_15]|uniref:Class I SAM-dependent methyltransferase n=1 Tax=Candidatus Aquitaenariimonas noxiae TaxID=1974741 RepID=A0A2J0KTU4_9BACT|nr:MAG: hypothetical protein COS99_03370 [Candidatus Omnitrophica bacterium CG07_land_8_20_14_0_80_42_15]
MLKEWDIRPEKAAQLLNRLRLQDIKSHFLDDKGNIINSYFLEVKCPACGKRRNSQKFKKESFSFKCCSNCGTLYVSPRPKPPKLHEYYRDSGSIAFFIKEILEKTAKARKEKILLPKAKKAIFYLKKFRVSRKLLVEIGGGNGLFLETMKEIRSGFKRYLNIEPSKEGARLTQNRGFDVIEDIIENVKDLHADCICAFELIEHLFDPLSFCIKIKRLLNKNGIFILTTPSTEGLDLMLLGRDSDNISAPNHLNYFNIHSIEILLKRAGLKTVAIETPGVLDIDILKNKVVNGYKLEDRYISFLLKQPNEVLEKFQLFLQQNKLSSHMFVVNKKI